MNDCLHVIKYLEQFPDLIKIVWGISVILFVTILVLIGYIKFLRSHLRKNEKVVAIYEKEYESLLITYLYSGNEENEVSEEQQTIIDKLKLSVVNEFKRNIVISVLLRLRNEISGEMAESIQRLYFQTGLINYALVKLKNKNWFIVAKGIRELTKFYVEDAHNEISKYLTHSKREVRKEVQLYLVTLFHFEGLTFLNDLENILSEWDQIQLLEVLQKIENQQIPNIAPWLKSKNESVVMFALKLSKIYNQFDMKDVLIDLLNHPTKKIRIAAIQVLSHLQVLDAIQVLKNNFNNISTEEQIAFFKMLETMFSEVDEAFILEHTIHENFEIKFSALKILKSLNTEKFESLEMASQDLEYIKIFKFLENN